MPPHVLEGRHQPSPRSAWPPSGFENLVCQPSSADSHSGLNRSFISSGACRILQRRCRMPWSARRSVCPQKSMHRCRTSGASTEQQATHVRSGRDLGVERDQGQAGGVGKRAEVRIGPEIRRGPRTFGERLPRFEEFIRLCRVADSPVQSQGSICLPRLVWTHDLFLHDVLVCQQPQKTQLGNAAERQLFVLKIAEPMPCPEFRLDGPGAILAECRGICSRQL